MTVKVCRICGEEKPIEQFYRNRMTKDGRRGECKVCCNRLKNEWKMANRQRDNEYVKRSRNRNPESVKRSVYGWRKLHPGVSAAYSKVRRAVKSGELLRPESCPQCGEKTIVDAHHEDYGKPLDVDWMCRKCHATLNV